MALIKCHECGNDVSTEAPACPHCGAPTKKPTSAIVRYGGGFIVLLLILGAIGQFFRHDTNASSANPNDGQPTQSADASAGAGDDQSAAKEPEPVPEPKYETLQQAIDGIRPLMTDSVNDISPGAIVLASWASTRLTWHDLKKLKATNRARVLKDADEERGRIICTTGQIIEIAVERSDGNAFNVGGIADEDGIYRFVNVGSSGELVEGSYASMCGIVIGRVDYSNSMGGTSHAVQLVGLFDLPTNRRASASGV